MKRCNLWKLIIPIVFCNIGGFAASVFTAPAIPTWYASLIKPWFSPPNWVFAPAWTILYTLMGISFFCAWCKWKNLKESGWMRPAFAMFDVQFFFNILWSILFFGLRSPFLGFVDIALLWLAIAGNIFLFYKIDRKAAWLLVPYIAWVSFALVLNYSVMVLN